MNKVVKFLEEHKWENPLYFKAVNMEVSDSDKILYVIKQLEKEREFLLKVANG